jgi:hypothetical protein
MSRTMNIKVLVLIFASFSFIAWKMPTNAASKKTTQTVPYLFANRTNTSTVQHITMGGAYDDQSCILPTPSSPSCSGSFVYDLTETLQFSTKLTSMPSGATPRFMAMQGTTVIFDQAIPNTNTFTVNVSGSSINTTNDLIVEVYFN